MKMNFQKLENGEILTDVDHILDIIKKKGKISVQELGRKLNRSTDCIEILVEVLEENNLIEKHFTLNKIFYTIKDEKKKNTVSNKSVKDVVKYTKLKINSIKNNQKTRLKMNKEIFAEKNSREELRDDEEFAQDLDELDLDE